MPDSPPGNMSGNRTGYVQDRRGGLAHVESGRMSVLDYGFHRLLLQLADPGTGILWTNAAELAYRFPKASHVLIRKLLSRMRRGGYIRSFARRGSHGKYPVLLNRFLCTALPMKGYILNATQSNDWRAPVYEAVSRAVTGAVSGHSKERAREEFKNLETNLKENPRPPTPRPPATPPGGYMRKPPEPPPWVHERDRRLEREARNRVDAQVGQGPEIALPPPVCCLECRLEMNREQLRRCLAGKPPFGPGSTCAKHPAKKTA